MGRLKIETMKLAVYVSALVSVASGKKCTASRGPRPDDQADVTMPMMKAETTQAPVTEPAGWNELTMAPPSNDDGECVCGIEDYNNPNIASWRTNCPSGCALYEYLEEVEDKLNDDWRKVEAKLTQLGRSGENLDLHLTLEQILQKIKEALNNIKKEKDQFLAIRRIYRSGGISDIINDQRLKLSELTTRKSELQISLSNLQKEFKEQAGFCKVSFMQYDE